MCPNHVTVTYLTVMKSSRGRKISKKMFPKYQLGRYNVGKSSQHSGHSTSQIIHPTFTFQRIIYGSYDTTNSVTALKDAGQSTNPTRLGSLQDIFNIYTLQRPWRVQWFDESYRHVKGLSVVSWPCYTTEYSCGCTAGRRTRPCVHTAFLPCMPHALVSPAGH